MDEHTVNRIINELGGAKALMEEMDEYQEIVDSHEEGAAPLGS